MKGTDLMIGDYVYMGGVIRKVIGISYSIGDKPEDTLLTTIIPSMKYPEGNLSFRAFYANPIPLSSEILKKNGFVCDSDDARVSV